MYQTLHWVRLVLLGVILAGTVITATAGSNLSTGKIQTGGAAIPAIPSVTFKAAPGVTNNYGRPLPVPETPDIFLGMAGIGVMLILRRFFKR